MSRLSISPHGIGSIINRINNEYIREYGDTFIDKSVGEVNNSFTVTASIYTQILDQLANGNYLSDTYSPAVSLAESYDSLLSGKGSVVETVDFPTDLQNNGSGGMAVDPTDGTIWVARAGTSNSDRETDNIWHLQRDGTVISIHDSIVTGDGSSGAYGIGVDPYDGTIWLAAFNNSTVYNVTRDMDIITSFGPGFGPMDISVDMDGTLWVSDGTNEVYKNIQMDGTLITDIGNPSTDNVHGVCVDPLDGTIWAGTRFSTGLYHLDRTGATIEDFTANMNGSDGSWGLVIDPADGGLIGSGWDDSAWSKITQFTETLKVVSGQGTYAVRRRN